MTKDDLEEILDQHLVYEEPFAEEIEKDIISISSKGDGVPVGCVMAYAGSTPPNGWLICDGREVSRIKYPALFNAIGTTYGLSNVGKFKIPDYREAALVGVGTRDSGVATHDAYALGQFKDDQFASHTHTQNAHSHTTNLGMRWTQGANNNFGLTNGGNYYGRLPDAIANATVATNQYTGATSGGTHGKRMGVNYIIKAL